MPSEECVMRTVSREELDGVPVWVRDSGFPGELRDGDLAAARRLLGLAPGARAVVAALGAETFWWVGVDQDECVTLGSEVDVHSSSSPGGFALGTGDGATLAGLPVAWGL